MSSKDERYILLTAWLRAIFCIYVVASIPWRLAFCPEFALSIDKFPGFVATDLAATIFFTYDAIILARLTLIGKRQVLPETVDVLKDQIVEEDAELYEQFRTNNSRWNILIHFLSAFPFEYASIFSFLTADEWPNYLMTNRLLRLIYLPWYLNELSALLARRGYVKNIGVRRTWLLFFTMALAGHLCGCVFYLIGRREAMNGVRMTWPEVAGIYTVESSSSGIQLDMVQSAFEAYIMSLYWAYITMITTGFGDVVPLCIPETVWSIFSMFIGVLITALTIANLQLLVTNLDASRLNFQRKIEVVKKFMHYRKLPATLQDRILSFYDYQWTVLKGADEEEILAELPRTLQQQVSNFLCRDIIASLSILRNANNALLNALVECSEMNIYSPNEEIVKCGEKLRGAILVAHGEVEVLKGDTVERKMRELDRFAEESLFLDKISPHTVRSKGFSEVILIPAALFQKIISAQCEQKDIDDMREKTLTIAKSRSKANKMFGFHDNVTPSSGFQKHCHPNSAFRKIWDCLVLSGHIFYMFSIPLSLMSIVDNEPFSANPVLLSLGYAVDTFFIVDAVFEFHYFMFLQDGLIVFDKEHIHKHYVLKRNILRESIGLIPFDLISIVFDGRYCHYCRVLKLVRVPNLLLYTESIGGMMSELNIDLSFIRVIKLNIVMLLVCHWVGCCWYMMADLSIHYGFDQNWIIADENNPLFSVKHSDFNGFSAYLRSVYWAVVGMSTVGYGDIVPTNILETTFSTVTILFGGLLLPAVVGGLAAYMSNFQFAKKHFRKQLSRTKIYLKELVKPGDIAIEKILRYYKFTWSHRGGINLDQDVMDELSTPIRTSVSAFISEGVIMSVPFFSRFDDTMRQLMVSALQPRQFVPSDVIIKEGGIGSEMFFLHRGKATASLASLPKVPYLMLRSGDYFGENSLLYMNNFETVKATTYCECFSLSKSDFDEALEGSPIAKKVKADIANFHLRTTVKSKRVLQNIAQHSKCLRLVSETSLTRETPSSKRLKTVLLPTSRHYLMWNCFLFAACVYNAWTIPFRLAFKTSLGSSIVIDWIFDMFFVLDMYLNYRFVGFSEDGEVIVDIEKIKQNYMARRFKLDIITSCPFDLVAFLLLPTVTSSIIGLDIGDMLRVLKLLRFPRYFVVIEKLFAALQDKNIPLGPFRLVEFFSGVILIAHLAGCGFFALARWNSNDSCLESLSDVSCQWEGTWIKRQIYNGKLPADGGEVWQQYIRSFNWALPTLVVVVIGDVVPTTSPETLYAFLWMVIGVTINASIIGNVANIVANLESEQNDFASRVDEIKRYMFKHHLNSDLHSKADDFTRYLWTAHRGSTSEDDLILNLPHSLRTMTLQRRVKQIQSCPFFDFCSSDIVNSLALCMRPLIFSPLDVIAHPGDMGQEMFFLDRGSVQVVSADSRATVFATLVEGSYFGEMSLFFKQPRATAVRAVTFCDILELQKKALFTELKRRDFDLMQMLNTFAIIHEDNKRRNKAIQDNLLACKNRETKLSRMIDADIMASRKKRIVHHFFMPGSQFRFVWDVLCTMGIIYFSIFTLFRIAFRAVEEETVPLVGFDFVVDALFVADFYMRSTYFAFPEHGSIVTETASIRKHYLENGLLLDLVSCLSVLDGCLYKFRIVRMFKLRMICLLRVLRIPSFFNTITDHLSLRNIRIGLASNLLVRITFFYAIANHWVSCIWFIIHRELERDLKSTWATTDCPGGGPCTALWDESEGKHNICSLSMVDCYIRSLHFSITTLSTVGYGDISPVTELETIWENVVVLIGACFLAGLIGAMVQLLSQNDTMGANSFKTKIQKLKEYMSYRNIPPSIQASILYFHHCRWQDSQAKDERETLSILPEPLQLDISYAVKARAIQLVPILKALPNIVQKRLCNAMTLQVYPPHAVIYSVGELGWEIYFIVSGVATVVLPTDLSELDSAGRVDGHINRQKYQSIGLLLGLGNHVGESCLRSESGVRQESVIAKSKVEMYVISNDDLDAICMFMEPSKRKALIHSLLTRNGNCWHTFEDLDESEIEATSTSDIELSMSSGSGRERQSSRNSAAFTWNSSKSLNAAAHTNNRTTSVMLRRRLSAARLRNFTVVAPQLNV